MGPMGGTSGTGAGGAVLSIGTFEIVLVDSDSAVGAAMVVSGVAIAVMVDCSVGADNGRSAVPGGESDIGPLLADGGSNSVNAKVGAAGKASAGAGTSGASARCHASAGRVTTSG